MERLHNALTKKKKLLDNEMIETVTTQIELDKTAECFRTAHQERESLIEQWVQTIEQMQKRDTEIDKGSNVRPAHNVDSVVTWFSHCVGADQTQERST